MLIRHGIQTIVELSALDYDIYAVMDKTLTSSSVDNMVLNAVGGPKFNVMSDYINRQLP